MGLAASRQAGGAGGDNNSAVDTSRAAPSPPPQPSTSSLLLPAQRTTNPKNNSAAVAVAQAGSDGDNSGDDVSCVLRPVLGWKIAEQVRRIVEEYAQGSKERREAAVNYKSSSNDTPLNAAHRRRDGALVAFLLESGADATSISAHCHPLALAIHYGLIKTLRALLLSGKHDANEQLRYGSWTSVEGDPATSFFCRAVHLAVVPPSKSPYLFRPPPQLEALEVLVREFGADVNGRDGGGDTPLHWLVHAAKGHRERALDDLLSLGADLEARGSHEATPIFAAATWDAELLQHFLSRGASANVFSTDRISPLMQACCPEAPVPAAVVSAVARASSPQTCRAVNRCGDSAIDMLLTYKPFRLTGSEELIALLLSLGAPVRPSNAPRLFPIARRLVPIAARLGERRASEAAAHANDPPTWQVHEAMVGLAFDFLEAREVDEAVRVRERRVEELEEELRALGVGTEDTTDESEEEEEEEEEEESGDDDDVAALAAQLAKV